MALKLWKSELIRFKEYLEKKFDVEITDEAVLEAVKEENKVRKVMKDLYHVMALDPAPIKGGDLFKVLYGSGFKSVSYTHLRAHETDSYLVCRLLLEKKKKYNSQSTRD